MTTLQDVFKAVQNVMTVTRRLEALAAHVDRMESEHTATRERLIRVEAFIDLVRPAVTKALEGPSGRRG